MSWYWYLFVILLIFDIGFVCGAWWFNSKRVVDKAGAYEM